MKDIEYYIFIKTGSVFEPPKLKGISHFLEHIVFNYSLEKSGLNNFLEENNIDIDIETQEYSTIVTTWSLDKILLKKLRKKLKYLILNPEISIESLEQEKKIIREEIAYRKTLPDILAQESFFSFVLQNTALETAIIGKKQFLKEVTLAMLKKWHEKFYRENNLVEIIFDRKSRRIRVFPHKLSSRISPIISPRQRKKPHRASIKKIINRGLSSHVVCVGWLSKNPSKKERAILDVFRRIFGSMNQSFISSILIQKEHLIYKGEAFLEHYKGLSLLGLQFFTTQPNNCLKKLEQYKAKLLNDKINKDIFFTAQKLEIEYFQEPQVFMSYIIGKEFMSTGDFLLPRERIKILRNISYDDFYQCVKKLFSKDQFLTIVK
ncbi:MAG: insulinase family protein [Candidatus Paceibacterota bacterium]